MAAPALLFLSSLVSIIQANPLTLAAELQQRAAAVTPGVVPETTPTGSACTATATTGATAVPTAELALAVAGCVGVEPQGSNPTRNDILDGICKPFTLIFARGTTEDPNLGNVVGPPFVLALEAVFGANNVAVQGVNNYPAAIPDYCTGGSLTGAQNLASVRCLTLTSRHLPNTFPARRTNTGPMPLDQTLRLRLQPRQPGRTQCRRAPDLQRQCH
jgi:hypothetical protein